MQWFKFRSIQPLWFQTKNIIITLVFFLSLTYEVLADKQRYSKNYHHLKNLYQEKNLNHVFPLSLLYLALLLTLLLLLML